MTTDISEWVPGENCDVILEHYKHDPIPLVCYRIQSDPIGPRVRIHFETYWPDGEDISRDTEHSTVRHLWFYILIADEMLCPDGSWYPYSPNEVRKRVNDILHEITDICLYTQSGIISGLYCDEHSLLRNHFFLNKSLYSIFLLFLQLSFLYYLFPALFLMFLLLIE